MGRAACTVRAALYRLLPCASVIRSRKLQVIFSLFCHVSFVHLRLFKKLLSAAWQVWKAFLSAGVLSARVSMVIRAFSSWADKHTGAITIIKNIHTIFLHI